MILEFTGGGTWNSSAEPIKRQLDYPDDLNNRISSRITIYVK